ncbi:DUF4189 domain-containing protein [Lysobacter enzymogenes]|uniref:DUF4189 domain-containing protein n=1 Tax=Lysobacter sp. yr284 TaxID=1761791 RepID=UPI0009EA3244|nr:MULTISPECIES: DUF4189 domain-containing protein [Lysobacter]QCW24492.1 DUF4189 domain-containing protein [Lysobacter enzymogenes]
MNLRHFTLICTLTAISPLAIAQRGCPEGYYEQNSTGLNSCIPIPTGVEAQPTGPKWIKTWGAIAAEAGSGRVGVATGKDSKADAKRSAMKACQTGGRNCEVVLTYNHQCAAIAEVPDSDTSKMKKRGYATGPDEASSTRQAMSACEGANPGSACKIAYSDCSKPKYSP